MKASTRALAAALAALSVVGCDHELFRTSHGAVDDGNALLAQGQAAEALKAFEAAAAELPESPELDYDRGLAATAVGEFDEATQRLLRALNTRDPALRRRVYAALGAAYARWGEHLERTPTPPAAAEPEGDDAPAAAPEDPRKAALPKWERAVEHLEKALTLSPEPDPDVLRNLEVALLRVDPPCASRNDGHEPNDGPDRAAAITLAGGDAADPQQGLVAGPAPERLKWREQLLACPDDVDWFRLELDEGDRLSAELTRPKEAGALSLTLFTSDGTTALAPAGGEVGEAVEHTVGQGGAYLLRVDNVDDDEVSYAMAVEVRPPCARTEDRFEPNDTPADASTVSVGKLPDLKICPEDDDWYAVTLAEGESLFAFASLPEAEDEDDDEAADEAPAPVPLMLEVTDAAGEVLATGGPVGRARVVTLLTPGAGRYLVRVSGAPDLESKYELMVQVIPPCPEGDDMLEDNDTVEAAASLDQLIAEAAQQAGGQPGQAAQGQSWLLRICPGDDDWMSLEVQAEEPVQVSAVFDHAKGDLELIAFDERGVDELQASDQSSADHNGEALLLTPDGDQPRSYRLLVRGKGGAENFYLLKIDQPQGGGGGGQDDQQQDDQEQKDQDQDSDPGDGEQDPPKDSEPKDAPEDGQGDPQQPPRQPPPGQPQPRPADPLEEALDKLDRNPQNLEALETLKASPLTNHPPEKDW